MMNLRELQLAMLERVVHGDPAIGAFVRRSHGLDSTRRLAVYASAYSLRLTEALCDSFPALVQVMGAAPFDAMALSYIAAQPSSNPSIRWFGARLPDHLQAGGNDALADIARWEWTLGIVFDGPDVAPVGLDAVTSIAAANWVALRVQFCSNLQRVAVRADAVQAWRAATAETAGSPPASIALATEWLVWRRGLATTFRSLLPDEAWALDAARGGATFGELCEGLACRADVGSAPARAASLLKQWLTDGCVAALACEPVP